MGLNEQKETKPIHYIKNTSNIRFSTVIKIIHEVHDHCLLGLSIKGLAFLYVGISPQLAAPTATGEEEAASPSEGDGGV